ncbi:MAG: hypothetical protein WC732_04770 [Candidatus Omnitrophota bacterium]
MSPLQKSPRNSFILRLHKNLYDQKILERMLKEDKEWIKPLKPSDKNYHLLECKTTSLSDVLEWANYLFYLNKTS